MEKGGRTCRSSGHRQFEVEHGFPTATCQPERVWSPGNSELSCKMRIRHGCTGVSNVPLAVQKSRRRAPSSRIRSSVHEPAPWYQSITINRPRYRRRSRDHAQDTHLPHSEPPPYSKRSITSARAVNLMTAIIPVICRTIKAPQAWDGTGSPSQVRLERWGLSAH